jgi:hypothetical protein
VVGTVAESVAPLAGLFTSAAGLAPSFAGLVTSVARLVTSLAESVTSVASSDTSFAESVASVAGSATSIAESNPEKAVGVPCRCRIVGFEAGCFCGLQKCRQEVPPCIEWVTAPI